MMTRQHTLITLSVYRYVQSCPSKEPTYPADLGTQHEQTITLKDIISGAKDSISKRRVMNKIYARNERHTQYLSDTHTHMNILWRTTTTKRHVIWVKLTLFTGLWFSGRAHGWTTQNQPVFWYQIYTTKLRAYPQSDLIFIHSTYRMSWQRLSERLSYNKHLVQHASTVPNSTQS